MGSFSRSQHAHDEVFELEAINSVFGQTGGAFVIGASDVSDPAAKTGKSSPLYGMPIPDVANARTVLFVKRSWPAGYAGVDNDVFYMDNMMMLLTDAKKYGGRDRKGPEGLATYDSQQP